MTVQTAVECVCCGMQVTILVATWVALGRRPTWSLPSVLALVSIGICSTLAIALLAMNRTDSAQARAFSSCQYGAAVVSVVDPLALMATRCNPPGQYLAEAAVIVWRAWVLWPRSRWAQAALVANMLAVAAGVVLEFGLLWVWQQPSDTPPQDRLGLYKLRTMVWLGPMICANALSTALIGRRVWTYRRNIRGSLGRLTGPTSVERVLTLLLAAGILYCMAWIIYLVVVVNIDSDPLLHIQGLDNIIDTAYRSFAVRHIGGGVLDS
ncbi:hypothetical protein EV122DRAFT_256388 [Schizophyllum commune]